MRELVVGIDSTQNTVQTFKKGGTLCPPLPKLETDCKVTVVFSPFSLCFFFFFFFSFLFYFFCFDIFLVAVELLVISTMTDTLVALEASLVEVLRKTVTIAATVVVVAEIVVVVAVVVVTGVTAAVDFDFDVKSNGFDLREAPIFLSRLLFFPQNL